MAKELRKTGISVVGDVPWGTHFCHFYDTKQDLLDALVPYFKAGLESNEFCLWVVSNSELITVEEAKRALRQAVPDLDRYLVEGNLEVVSHDQWFLNGGAFDRHRVANGLKEKLNESLARGYAGMRINGSPAWLHDEGQKELRKFEEELDKLFVHERIITSCTYPLAAIGGDEVFDVVRTHQFAIARRQGQWEVIETPQLIQANAKINRLNEELEQRVLERSSELSAANEELRREIADRKQVERELRENQQRYESLVHSIDGIVWEVNAETFRFTFVSKQAERILGYPLAQWLEPSFWADHLHPDDRDWAIGFCVDATQRRVDHQFEYRMIASDGRVVWLRDHVAVNVRIDQSVRLRGVMLDITGRKQAEALLHAKEQEFRAIVENAPDQIIRYDRKFRRTYVNPAVARAYGLPAEALIGKPIGSVIRGAGHDVKDDELAQLRQRIQAVFDTGKSCEFEITWPSPTGLKYYSSRLFPELDLNGSVINVLGSARDITERKQAEEALDERLRFETLVTELSAAFANLSPNEVDREIDKWLQSLVEFLGVDRATFFQLGEDWKTLYLVHSYTVPGIEPLSLPPIGLNEQFPWITDQLRQGNTIKWSRIPDDLAEQAAKEKEYAAKTGAKSVLNIPVLVGGSVICTISFTSIRIYCDWPDTMVARLRLVGEIFAAAIERKRAEGALREAEQKYRDIFENAGEGIFQSTPDGRYIAANSALARMYGFASTEELIHSRQDISRQLYVDPTRREEFKHQLEEQGAVRGFEHEVFRKDGSRLWISVNARVVREQQGEIQYYEGTAQDITDRKRAEEALRESEERYRELFENAKDATYVHDLNGRYTSVNRAAEKLSGYTRAEILGKSFTNFVPPEQIENIRKQLCRKLIEEGETSYESEVITKDGRRVAVEVNSHVIFGNGVAVAVQGTARDITERKAAEEKLKATSEQLRALSARLQSAREEEGTRIAREIHDELGSVLTSLKWDLEGTDKVLAGPMEPSQLAGLREKLHALMKVTDLAISAIRRIASELRPSVLDDLGLVAAIEWQSQQFQARTGIICACDCSLEKVELSEEQSTAVFRILQEALTNVLRHAQATKVDIKINKENGYFTLSISDNGKGITENEKSEQQSLGILGMRERAHLVGGEIDIKGAEEKGTVVMVRVPILGQDRVLKMTR